jgi:hypothetical protein
MLNSLKYGGKKIEKAKTIAFDGLHLFHHSLNIASKNGL